MLAHASRSESGLHARESSGVAMVNSSPEYSITKPGLHHLRKRDKPLRTYGRQPSTPEAQSEPPPKRQRLSALKQQQQKQQEEEPSSLLQSQNDAPKPDALPIAPSSETKATQDTPTETKPDIRRAPSSSRGSTILSFFKPAPAPSKPKDETPPQPQEPQPESEEEPLAPPESPPKRKQPLRRKPRLLKIKAVTHEPPDESSPESDKDNPPQAQRDSRQPLKNTTPNTLANAEPESTSSSTTTSCPSLSPRKKSLRYHQKPSPKRRTSKPSSPAVQTTLNISARAAFSECKICDTVWNPLYPDDVKFHDKTHKAVLRAQKKRKMDEL